jgi:sec-independent protein translocase protein TatC
VTIVIASCFFYRFTDPLLAVLSEPVGPLYYLSPAEGFLARMGLTLIGGVFLSLPVLFYQLWAFVAVGLTRQEKKYIVLFAPLSLVLFLGGAAFAYFSVLPMVLKFFLSFSSHNLVPMLTVSKYISFVGTFCLGFGLVFEMPLVIVFLTKIGIATPAFLVQMRRHAIVLIFIVSAFLTPPDFISQIFMAVPLVILYEMSVLFSRLVLRLKEQKS